MKLLINLMLTYSKKYLHHLAQNSLKFYYQHKKWFVKLKWTRIANLSILGLCLIDKKLIAGSFIARLMILSMFKNH